MFRRILVPTDGSEQLAGAMPLVERLARRDGASVLFVCVEPRAVNMGDVIDNRAAVAAHAIRLQTIEHYVEQLQATGIEAAYAIEFGRPEHGIEAAAKQHASDLIVMAPQRRAGFDAVLHPSVTARMFSSSPAPLLIVPQHADGAEGKPPTELLGEPDATVDVPLDGSELAERALPFAVAFAAERGRGLHLVRVVPPPASVSPLADDYEKTQPHYHAAQDEAHRYVKAVQARVEQETGLSVTAEVTIGKPAAEIVDIARERPANLIVMSTHGHGELGRLFVGSVAADVMWSAGVPVLVIPPHATPAERAVASEPATVTAE